MVEEDDDKNIKIKVNQEIIKLFWIFQEKVE